jgi:hypothetical protein
MKQPSRNRKRKSRHSGATMPIDNSLVYARHAEALEQDPELAYRCSILMQESTRNLSDAQRRYHEAYWTHFLERFENDPAPKGEDGTTRWHDEHAAEFLRDMRDWAREFAP